MDVLFFLFLKKLDRMCFVEVKKSMQKSNGRMISARIIVLLIGAGGSVTAFVDTMDVSKLDTSFDSANDFPPVAQFDWEPEFPAVMQVVTFDGSSSYEPFGFISEYYWSYTIDGGLPVEIGYGKTIQYLWTDPGVYLVTLQVTDDDGQTDSITKSVPVSSNQPPVANFTWQAAGLSVTFSDTSTDDGEITFRGWDFDDDGKFDDFGDIVSYVFPFPGSYNMTLIVQDDEGFMDNHTELITVNVVGEADLVCDGTLVWSSIPPSGLVTGSFSVRNNGDADTLLNWSVESVPSWGDWTFTPESGEGLRPKDGTVIVEVIVVAPDVKQDSFTGLVVVCNEDDESDCCELSVSLSTPKHKVVRSGFWDLFEQYPLLFRLLQRVS